MTYTDGEDISVFMELYKIGTAGIKGLRWG